MSQISINTDIHENICNAMKFSSNKKMCNLSVNLTSVASSLTNFLFC